MPKQITRETMLGANLSDSEVAGKVRMLMRNQLDHEFVCTLARDRIMVLSAENQALRDDIDQMHYDASIADA